MFKRDVLPLDEVLKKLLREEGLEMPLLQKRLVDAWEVVTGNVVSRYTAEKYIRNQTLFVKITNPALRQDLSMMRTQLVKRLNEQVGSFVISDIKIFRTIQRKLRISNTVAITTDQTTIVVVRVGHVLVDVVIAQHHIRQFTVLIRHHDRH